nr:hypothetical protein [Cronobacter sakazakii]
MRFLTGQQVAALGGLDPHAALSDVAIPGRCATGCSHSDGLRR